MMTTYRGHIQHARDDPRPERDWGKRESKRKRDQSELIRCLASIRFGEIEMAIHMKCNVKHK